MVKTPFTKPSKTFKVAQPSRSVLLGSAEGLPGSANEGAIIPDSDDEV